MVNFARPITKMDEGLKDRHFFFIVNLSWPPVAEECSGFLRICLCMCWSGPWLLEGCECVCVCVCVCVCACMSALTCVYVRTCACHCMRTCTLRVYARVRAYVCTYVCAVCLCASTRACDSVHVCVWFCACACEIQRGWRWPNCTAKARGVECYLRAV